MILYFNLPTVLVLLAIGMTIAFLYGVKVGRGKRNQDS